jgi:hypothetical protein
MSNEKNFEMWRKQIPKLSSEEQKLIDWLEHVQGHKLSPQEVNLVLDQARVFGEL